MNMKRDGMKTIKIFMVGGRRCGKTTVITSLWSNADKTLAGTNLSLVTDNQLIGALQETYDLSESYFDEPDMESFVRVSDDNMSSALKAFQFSLQIAGKKTGIAVQFSDVPGEFFVEPEHYDTVKREIRESHVIIIAIDTPCLMEDMDSRGYGKRHSKGNKTENIIEHARRRREGAMEPRTEPCGHRRRSSVIK